MSLDSTRLKNALKTEIEAQIRSFLVLGVTPYPELTKFSEALATGISSKVIAEFTANAALSSGSCAGGTYTVTGGGGGTVTIPAKTVTGGII